MAFAVIASAAFLVLHARLEPYSRNSENNLQLYCLVVLFVTVMYGLVVFAEHEGQRGLQAAHKEGGSTVLSYLIIFLNCFILVWFG